MNGPLEFLVVLAILLAVVTFVTVPLRRVPAASKPTDAPVQDASLAELEAAREAKYRELRDADLDHRTGKLSDADYAEVDRALRGEAIEILRDIDREQERAGRALPSPER
jgi:hypothetical protein